MSITTETLQITTGLLYLINVLNFNNFIDILKTDILLSGKVHNICIYVREDIYFSAQSALLAARLWKLRMSAVDYGCKI